MKNKKVIHGIGNLVKGRATCGAGSKRSPIQIGMHPSLVTCKRCLAVMRNQAGAEVLDAAEKFLHWFRVFVGADAYAECLADAKPLVALLDAVDKANGVEAEDGVDHASCECHE